MNDELWPSILHFPVDPPVVHDPTSPPIWLLNLLFGLSGCCWIFAYVTAVRRGWLEKVSGAPYIAVGTNVTWDFVYAFVFHIQPVQDIISTLYFIIEAILLIQVFQYGHKDAPTMSRNSFRMMICAMVLFGLAAHTAAAWDFADPGGYTGFATTLLTSLSFLLILNRRRSTAGQTMYIAIVKMIGTAAAAAGFAALYPTRMLLWVFFTTMVVIDVIYVVQLHRRFRAEGLSPWRKI